MNIELQMLALSSLLGIVQIFLAAGTATQQRGMKWNISSRDQQKPPLTGVAGRLDRALANFKETFPFFIAAIVLTQFLQQTSSLTALGAQLYFWGRVFYVPIYAFDIKFVRSIAWLASIAGILMVFAGVFG